MNSSATSIQARPTCRRVLRSGLPTLGVFLTLIVMLFGLTGSALAQLDTGAISGVVSDPAGKVVQGATITANETTTGTTYTTTSSSIGYYGFPSVRPGTYELKISASGFKADLYSGIGVTVGSHVTQDISLVVGSNSESVTVTGGTVTLEKETSEVDAAISPEQVADLPLAV